MKTLNKNISIYMSIFLTLFIVPFLIIAMSGCTSASSQTNEVSQDSEVKLPYEVDQNDYELVQTRSSALAAWNTQDYVEYAHLIVVGTVTGVESPVLIQPKGGELEQSMYFTDYAVHVDEVLFDITSNIENIDAVMQDITLRTDSGAGTNILYIDENEPELKIGETYLFFLKNEPDESAYKTGNDYYILISNAGGAWDIPAEDVYVCKNKYDNLTVDAATLEELITQYGGNKINEGEENRQKFAAELKERAEAEDLPVDSYLKYVDEQENLHSSWATVLPEEMHSEFEESVLRQRANQGLVAEVH